MPKLRQLKFFEHSSLKTVKEEFNTLFGNQSLKKYIYLAFFLLGIDFIALGISWFKLPPELPLFYSRPWGESRLIAKGLIFILPLSGLIINLINLRLASVLFKTEFLLSQVLIWTSVAVSALTSITLFKILIIIL